MTTYAVTSEVFTAATIVQVVVDDAALGDWVAEPEPVPVPVPVPGTGTGSRTGAEIRTGTVTVRLADVLKGRIADPVGASVTVDVVLRRTGGARLGDVVGLWSHVPTDPGARLVAYCDAGTRSLAVALTDAHCVRLTESGPVLADLRTAVALQRRSPTADRLLTVAAEQRATGGAVLAQYVWVATREAVRASLDRFDRLMQVAEDPSTRVEAQEAYLVSAYEDVTFTDAYPPEHRSRLVRAMLRCALDPRLGALRAQLLGTYVPNLLASAAAGPVTADDVFGGADTLRDQVRAELDDPRAPATTSPVLSAWLDGDLAPVDARGPRRPDREG